MKVLFEGSDPALILGGLFAVVEECALSDLEVQALHLEVVAAAPDEGDILLD